MNTHSILLQHIHPEEGDIQVGYLDLHRVSQKGRKWVWHNQTAYKRINSPKLVIFR